MTAVSRTAQFAHVHKVLKRHYHPVAPAADRSVMEHLLFAACLEDARYDVAEESFAALVHTFYDWNEVRVSSLSELSEVMGALPDPRAAAARMKRILQSVFEATYSFDLENCRKKNLGPTINWLEKLDGTTRFVVAYVVQSALGGHAIPVDTGTLRALRICELIEEKDLAAGVVPGLERAVSKAKGIEFGSLLHQLGADLTINPYAKTLHALLLEINPQARANLPRRRAPAQPAPPARAAATAADGKSAPEPQAAGGQSEDARKPAPKRSKKGAAESEAEKAGPPGKGSGRLQKKADQSVPDDGKASSEEARQHGAAKKSATQKLSKRKPR